MKCGINFNYILLSNILLPLGMSKMKYSKWLCSGLHQLEIWVFYIHLVHLFIIYDMLCFHSVLSNVRCSISTTAAVAVVWNMAAEHTICEVTQPLTPVWHPSSWIPRGTFYIKMPSYLGLYSLRRHRLTGIGIPIINLRRSDDRLRFITGIPILIRWRLLSE